MDKEMPVMDGLACTSKIRDMERKGELRRHVPIIAVTANARSEQIATLLAAGMDDVVSKPFRIGELVPKIEELNAKYCREKNERELLQEKALQTNDSGVSFATLSETLSR